MAVAIPFVAGHWYYNTESGQLTQGNNILNAANNVFGGLGWHELNIPGSASAAAAAAEARKEFPAGKAPTSQGLSKAVPQAIAGGVAQAAGASLTGLTALGDFASRLSQAHTWERVAEVLLGVVLIAVGLARMTHAVPLATAIASKVP